jgi:hypothetical protein
MAHERVVQVPEALAWDQARGASDKEDVVVESRAVFRADAEIGSDTRGDVFLKDKRPQRFSLVEPQKVDVADQSQFLRQLGIHPEIDKL